MQSADRTEQQPESVYDKLRMQVSEMKFEAFISYEITHLIGSCHVRDGIILRSDSN